jgi:hypothetical protein
MHHIALCIPYIAHFNHVHLFAYTIDPTELEREEQVQVEDVNTDPEQGKPRCI